MHYLPSAALSLIEKGDEATCRRSMRHSPMARILVWEAGRRETPSLFLERFELLEVSRSDKIAGDHGSIRSRLGAAPAFDGGRSYG